MEIDTKTLPMAGELFQFDIEEETGQIKVDVYLDSELLFQHDCDDPPCHEMLIIPEHAHGSTLEIRTLDAIGNAKSFEYEVSGHFKVPIHEEMSGDD